MSSITLSLPYYTGKDQDEETLIGHGGAMGSNLSLPRVSGATLQSSTTSSVFLKDVNNLRRVIDDIPIRLWAVAVISFWERFTFWGLTAPWQNYMENGPNKSDGTPGALGLGQAMATRLYCAFYILYYTTPILFAVVSDARLGRFRTLCISGVLYVLGCVAMVATSTDKSIEAGWGLPGMIITMVLVGLGGGAFKMITTTFIADQYNADCSKVKTLKTGEQVIADRTLTLQYIYNLHFWVGNVGSLSWFVTTAFEHYTSFTMAYTVTLASMVVAMLMLVCGSKWYVKLPPQGNVIPVATKILACAAKENFRMGRADPQYQLDHHGKTVSWSSQLVKELCSGLQACRVLLTFIIFYVCFDQMQNNLVSQAKQMQIHGLPNDMMSGLNQVACIIIGPIVQYGIYPFFYQRNIQFRPVARITVGFTFIALAMLYSMIVQQMIYSAPPCYKSPGACKRGSSIFWTGPNEVNAWVQAPVYLLIATGEIFAMVTALEYANDHAPKGMKAIVQAINLLIAGVGSAVAMGFTPIAHDPLLVILYGCLFGAMTASTVVVWALFHKYDRLDAEAAERKVSLEVEKEAEDKNKNVKDENVGLFEVCLQRATENETTLKLSGKMRKEGEAEREMVDARRIAGRRCSLTWTGKTDIADFKSVYGLEKGLGS